MNSTTRYSNYDNWASIYDEQMSTDLYENIVAQLEKLLLQNIPKNAHIFDLCCGTGQVAQQLLRKGYRVTGLDGSEMMLHYARKNAPGAEFILDDARFFKLPPTFHSVISTHMSLCHILKIEELKSVFCNVYTALLENGFFVFDLQLGEDFETQFNGNSDSYISDDNVKVSRWTYDSQNKLSKADVTKLQLINGTWQRSDCTYLFKAYSAADVQSALEEVGFTEVCIYYLKRDLGIKTDWAGWACVVCRKQLIQ